MQPNCPVSAMAINNYVRPVSECNPPPIGVYWDIENCSVPFGKSALAVVMKIRDKFFEGYRETDFMVVCDISKENKDVIQELNNAQVTSSFHSLLSFAAEYQLQVFNGL